MITLSYDAATDKTVYIQPNKDSTPIKAVYSTRSVWTQSAKDNAQPDFDEGDYNPRKSGYHFSENGEENPNPYVKLNRALLLGEMEHPHTGKTLPIILREGNLTLAIPYRKWSWE